MNEQRTIKVDLELREGSLSSGDGKSRLSGYAALFETPATIGDLFVEKIQRGAFAKTIREGDPRALWSHDPSLILGRKSNGTLKIWEDNKGLRCEIVLPDTGPGRDALTLVKRKDVTGMSISFKPIHESWSFPASRDDLPVRTLQEVRLYEVSPVGWPAYETTSVEAV